jgi:urease accessory protein UreF
MPLDGTSGLAFYYGQTPFVSAMLKLVLMGQLACQNFFSKALNQTGEWLNGTKLISIESMGWLFPLLDISSSWHETAITRLFTHE